MARIKREKKNKKPNFIFLVEPGEPSTDECLVDMAKVVFQLCEMKKRGSKNDKTKIKIDNLQTGKKEHFSKVLAMA